MHTHSTSLLHSTRPPLPDVPAIYFVSPTLANIRRISEDLSAGLYDTYHISFIEPLPRTLLEEFASLVARDGTGENVEQVLDQYLSFVCPSPQLFSLLSTPSTTSTEGANTNASGGAAGKPATSTVTTVASSYYTLNAPAATEQMIEEEIDRIASGLFAVVVTSGQASTRAHVLIACLYGQPLPSYWSFLIRHSNTHLIDRSLIFDLHAAMPQKWWPAN